MNMLHLRCSVAARTNQHSHVKRSNKGTTFRQMHISGANSLCSSFIYRVSDHKSKFVSPIICEPSPLQQ